jgi:hypothetical protein
MGTGRNTRKCTASYRVPIEVNRAIKRSICDRFGPNPSQLWRGTWANTINECRQGLQQESGQFQSPSCKATLDASAVVIIPQAVSISDRLDELPREWRVA